jgi:hypothetical protein
MISECTARPSQSSFRSIAKDLGRHREMPSFALSRRQHGFESRWGYKIKPSSPTRLDTATSQPACPWLYRQGLRDARTPGRLPSIEIHTRRLCLPKHGARAPAELCCREVAEAAATLALRDGRPEALGYQLGRHGSVRLGGPGRRFTSGVEADLVGELSDQGQCIPIYPTTRNQV